MDLPPEYLVHVISGFVILASLLLMLTPVHLASLRECVSTYTGLSTFAILFASYLLGVLLNILISEPGRWILVWTGAWTPSPGPASRDLVRFYQNATPTLVTELNLRSLGITFHRSLAVSLTILSLALLIHVIGLHLKRSLMFVLLWLILIITLLATWSHQSSQRAAQILFRDEALQYFKDK